VKEKKEQTNENEEVSQQENKQELEEYESE
jgi:hypothetical protein